MPLAAPDARHLQPELDVLQRREPREQSVLLKHHRAIGAGPVDALAVERDGAGVGLEHAGGDVQQRALAAPAGTDDDDELARLGRHADAAECRHVGTIEVLVDPAKHKMPAASGPPLGAARCRSSRARMGCRGGRCQISNRNLKSRPAPPLEASPPSPARSRGGGFRRASAKRSRALPLPIWSRFDR